MENQNSETSARRICPLCGHIPRCCRCGQGEWVTVGSFDPGEQVLPDLGEELTPHLEVRVSETGLVEYRALTPTGGRLINHMRGSFLLTPYALPMAQWPAGLWKQWIEDGADLSDIGGD